MVQKRNNYESWRCPECDVESVFSDPAELLDRKEVGFCDLCQQDRHLESGLKRLPNDDILVPDIDGLDDLGDEEY